MTRRSTRSIQLAAACAATLLLSLLAAPTVEAWRSTCDNCYEGLDQWGNDDAQCCLDDRCDVWISQGYTRTAGNMEWCTSWQTEEAAGCNGQRDSCSTGGGGGGEDGACTIQQGEYCPPECWVCFVEY